jgi:hypothetical protein
MRTRCRVDKSQLLSLQHVPEPTSGLDCAERGNMGMAEVEGHFDITQGWTAKMTQNRTFLILYHHLKGMESSTNVKSWRRKIQ